MAGRPDMSRHVEAGMRAFMSLSPCSGVAHFVLEGPLDTPIRLSEFAGVYTRGGRRPDSLLVLGSDPLRYEPPQLYRKIVDLELPDRVRAMNMPDDERMAANLDASFQLVGMPAVLLGIGEAVQTQEESVLLYAVAGLPPEKALTRLRTAAQRRLNAEN